MKPQNSGRASASNSPSKRSKILDAGYSILDTGYSILDGNIQHPVSSIHFILLLLISVLGCMSQGQSEVMRSRAPVITPSRSVSAPRLMGIYHLSTLKGPFSQPTGIAVDNRHNLYVADSGKNAVYILDEDGKMLESIGRFGWRIGEFDTPTDVALDAQLRLYIADSGNDRIQMLSLSSGRFSIIAGKSSDGSEELVSLSKPQGVATDTRGYIYIADTWNHRILKVDPLGRLQMEIGGSQQFRNPQSLAVDSQENIYVSDTGNHRIHKMDFSGSQIAVWGSEQLQDPTGLAVDEFGYIYVVDRGSRKIQIFTPTMEYLRDFGQPFIDDPFDIAIYGNRAYVTDAIAGDIEVFDIRYLSQAETYRH